MFPKDVDVWRSIGIDFDNTIVNYDQAFVRCAREQQLVSAEFLGNKTRVRDTIRALPGGNWKWTQLQARVYGPGILQAMPFAGLREFLDRAIAEHVQVSIISHKSRYAAADTDGVDLREAAFGWLRARGFLRPSGPLDVRSVFFEAERAAKIDRIARCGCTDFVDDLIDILEDPAFPAGVRRYHFSGPGGTSRTGFSSWAAISRRFFDA